jgi:hypothetical protein
MLALNYSITGRRRFPFYRRGKKTCTGRPRKDRELVIHKKNERERERAYRVRNGVVLACNWKGDGRL